MRLIVCMMLSWRGVNKSQTEIQHHHGSGQSQALLRPICAPFQAHTISPFTVYAVSASKTAEGAIFKFSVSKMWSVSANVI